MGGHAYLKEQEVTVVFINIIVSLETTAGNLFFLKLTSFYYRHLLFLPCGADIVNCYSKNLNPF